MDRHYYSAIAIIAATFVVVSVLHAGIGEPAPALIVKQYYWKLEDGTVQITGAGRPTEKARIEAWIGGPKKVGNAVEKYNGNTVAIMAVPLDINEVTP